MRFGKLERGWHRQAGFIDVERSFVSGRWEARKATAAIGCRCDGSGMQKCAKFCLMCADDTDETFGSRSLLLCAAVTLFG